MDRRAFLTTTAGVAAVGLAGCIGASSKQIVYDIGMGSSAFVPQKDFEPHVGDRVRWRNTGMRTHTVTAYEAGIPEDATYFASGGFDSEKEAREAWHSFSGHEGAIKSGGTYEQVFEVPGTYTYFCIPHEPAGMVGEFTVKK